MSIAWVCQQCTAQNEAPGTYGATDTIHRCPHCRARHRIAFTSVTVRSQELLDEFAAPDVSRCPAEVGKSLSDAVTAFNAGAHAAGAVMARRALQALCIDKGADTSKNLFQQVEELRKNKALTSQQAAGATAVRFFGNAGAHPRADLLSGLSEAECSMAVRMAMELVGAIYP